MIKLYYQLTKPGIVYGNLLAAIAGFFLASHGHINLHVFLLSIIGIALVIASGCVFNNYLDRGIDAKMERTKKRAFVNRKIRVRDGLTYATILGLLGFFTLIFFVNTLTAIVGFIGFIFYVFVYGFAKRKSVHGTLVGSISGSMPLVGGYTAAKNEIDLAAVLLFVILAAWQMPHFYAIAIYRFDDYKKAKIPVLPVVKGMLATKIQIVFYILAFIFAEILLTVFKYTGVVFLVVSLIVGTCWLYLAIIGFRTNDNKVWGKKLFRFSLIVLLVFCLMISINWLLT